MTTVAQVYVLSESCNPLKAFFSLEGAKTEGMKVAKEFAPNEHYSWDDTEWGFWYLNNSSPSMSIQLVEMSYK